MDEFIIATLRYGTPLVYVTMAGVLASRAGIWHLGLEGLMIIGCCAAVLGVVQTDSIVIGLCLGCESYLLLRRFTPSRPSVNQTA